MLSAWCAEGFSPGEFWDQTVETWSAIMGGRRKMHEHANERMIASAWWSARLNRAETLEDLSKYLPRRPTPPSLEEIFAQWDALALSGYGVTVERLN